MHEWLSIPSKSTNHLIKLVPPDQASYQADVICNKSGIKQQWLSPNFDLVESNNRVHVNIGMYTSRNTGNLR